MPKMTEETGDQSRNNLEEMALTAIKGIVPYPVMVTGVSRKINIGNFENIDVYAGLAVPVMALPSEEDFEAMVKNASDTGFAIVSRETGDRYKHLKEMQGGGR